MFTMSLAHRSISGICLAFLIPACASNGDGSPDAGGSGKAGGTTGTSSAGTPGSSERRGWRQFSWRQFSWRDDRQFDRWDGRDFGQRDDWRDE